MADQALRRAIEHAIHHALCGACDPQQDTDRILPLERLRKATENVLAIVGPDRDKLATELEAKDTAIARLVQDRDELAAERDRLAYAQDGLQRMADHCRAKDWAEIERLRAALSSRDTTPPQDVASAGSGRLCEQPVDVEIPACLLPWGHEGEHSARSAAPGVPVEDTTPAWRCKQCGATRWVAASLNQGWTRRAQCVPCGWVDDAVLGPGWRAQEAAPAPVSPQEDTTEEVHGG